MKENIGVVMEDCFFPENLTAENVSRILREYTVHGMRIDLIFTLGNFRYLLKNP